MQLGIEEFPLTLGIYSLDIGARSGDRSALSYLRGFAPTDVLPGPRTPSVYACFPGSGVRITPNCHWARSPLEVNAGNVDGQ